MFDEAFGEITEAKRSRSWQAITDCLNEHTNAAMTVMTVRTMYKRAKKVLSQERQHMHVRRERSQPQENGDMTLSAQVNLLLRRALRVIERECF